MTISKIYTKLRKGSRGQYLLLAFCTFLSVLLISSFALMYFGPTVQNFLPEGGDTRKMASLLLLTTACGCFLFTVYASSLFFGIKAGNTVFSWHWACRKKRCALCCSKSSH